QNYRGYHINELKTEYKKYIKLFNDQINEILMESPTFIFNNNNNNTFEYHKNSFSKIFHSRNGDFIIRPILTVQEHYLMNKMNMWPKVINRINEKINRE